MYETLLNQTHIIDRLVTLINVYFYPILSTIRYAKMLLRGVIILSQEHYISILGNKSKRDSGRVQ
jgi:hypothetical protein